jgi:hypothetical protein
LKHLAYAARLLGKDKLELKVVADLVDKVIKGYIKGLASLLQEIR